MDVRLYKEPREENYSCKGKEEEEEGEIGVSQFQKAVQIQKNPWIV